MAGPADSSPRPSPGSVPGVAGAFEGSASASPALPAPQPPLPSAGTGASFGATPPKDLTLPVEQAAAAALGMRGPEASCPSSTGLQSTGAPDAQQIAHLPTRISELRLPAIDNPSAAQRIYLGLNADFLAGSFAFDPDEVMAFMIKRLEELRADDTMVPNAQDKEAVSQLIESYKMSLMTIAWSRRMASVAAGGKLEELLATRQEIKHLILSTLKEQCHLSLASGYRKLGGGHRLALFLKVDEAGRVSGQAVHKGEGLESFHPDWEFAAGQGYADPWIELNPVDLNRLEQSPFLDMLIDLWVPFIGDKPTEYQATDLFEVLLPEWPAGLTQRRDKVLAKPHRAGTCAIKPYVAEMLSSLPLDLARVLKLDLTCAAIEQYLDSHEHLDAAAAEVLDPILTKLMRRLSKQQAAERLTANHPLFERVVAVFKRGQDLIQRVRRETLEAVQMHRMDFELPFDRGGQAVRVEENPSLGSGRGLEEAYQADRQRLEEFQNRSCSDARKLELLEELILQEGRSDTADTFVRAMGRALLADFLKELPLVSDGIQVQRLLKLVQAAQKQAIFAGVPFDVNRDMFVATKLLALGLLEAERTLPVSCQSRLLSPVLALMLRIALGLRPTALSEMDQLREMVRLFKRLQVEPDGSDPLSISVLYSQTFTEQTLQKDGLLEWLKDYVGEHLEEFKAAISQESHAGYRASWTRFGGSLNATIDDMKELYLRPIAAFSMGAVLPPELATLRSCMEQVYWEAGRRYSEWSPEAFWALTYQSAGGSSIATLKIEGPSDRARSQATLLNSFQWDANRQPWEARLFCDPPASQNDLLSLKPWQQEPAVAEVVSPEAIHAIQAPVVMPTLGVSLWMDFVESHLARMGEPLFQEKLSSGLFSLVDLPGGPSFVIEAMLGGQDHVWESLQGFLIRTLEKVPHSSNLDLHNRLLRLLVQCGGIAAHAGKDVGHTRRFLQQYCREMLKTCMDSQGTAPPPSGWVAEVLTNLLALRGSLSWDESLSWVPREAAEGLAALGLQPNLRTPFRVVAEEAAMAWSLFEAEEKVGSTIPRYLRAHPLFPYRNIREVLRVGDHSWTFINDFGHKITLALLTQNIDQIRFSLSKEIEWMDGTRGSFELRRAHWDALPEAGKKLVDGRVWARKQGDEWQLVAEDTNESRVRCYQSGARLFSADQSRLELACESYHSREPLLSKLFDLYAAEQTLIWKNSGGEIVKIEIPELELTFHRSQREGQTVWSSPRFPGMEIDPRDQHPWLEPFSRYLKLRGRDGSSLVVIPDQRFEESPSVIFSSLNHHPHAVAQLQTAPCANTKNLLHPRLLTYRVLANGELQAYGDSQLYDTLFLALLCMERMDFKAAFTLIRELERRRIPIDPASQRLFQIYAGISNIGLRPQKIALLAHLQLVFGSLAHLQLVFGSTGYVVEKISGDYFQNWTNLREYALPLESEKELALYLKKDSQRKSVSGDSGWLSGQFSQWPLEVLSTQLRHFLAKLRQFRLPTGFDRLKAENLKEPHPVPSKLLAQEALKTNFFPYLQILHDYNQALQSNPEDREERFKLLAPKREEIGQLLRVALIRAVSSWREPGAWAWLAAYLVAPELPGLQLPDPEKIADRKRQSNGKEPLARIVLEHMQTNPQGPDQNAIEQKITAWLRDRSFTARFRAIQNRSSPELPIPDIAARFAVDKIPLSEEPLAPASLGSDLLQRGLVRLLDHGHQLAESLEALKSIYNPSSLPEDPVARRLFQQNQQDLDTQKTSQSPLRSVTGDTQRLEAFLLAFQTDKQMLADQAQEKIIALMTVPESAAADWVRQQGRILPQLSLQDVLVAVATDDLSLLYAANPFLDVDRLQQLRSSVASYLDATAQAQQTLRGLVQLHQLEQKREARRTSLQQTSLQQKASPATEAALGMVGSSSSGAVAEPLSLEAREAARIEAELAQDPELRALEHRLAATLTAPRCYHDSSDLLLPLFEVVSNIRVTPEQVEAYRALTQIGEAGNFNLKAPTGFGKSSVLLGLWLLKTRGTHPLTMLTVPAALLASSVQYLHQTLGRAFETSFIVLEITREQLKQPGALWELERTLKTAKAEKKIIILPIGALHALANLEIKETLYTGGRGVTDWDKDALYRILKLLMKEASLFIDESRECLSIHQRYDYAVGARQHLQPELCREIQHLYQDVVLRPNVIGRFELEFLPQGAEQGAPRLAVTQENYAVDLLPILAENAADDLLKQLRDNPLGQQDLQSQRGLLIKDLRNETTPEERSEVHHLMRHAGIEDRYLRLKRQLIVYLRACLPLKTGERYTLSAQVPSRVAVPVADGVANPKAEFATKEESADLTLQANLKFPVPAKTVESYGRKLASDVLQEGPRVTQSSRYRDFQAMARAAGIADDPNLLTEQDWQVLTEWLNQPEHLAYKATVIGEAVLPAVAFYPHKISSSGMQIALATQQVRGASGTPDFDTTHPRLRPLNERTPVLGNLVSLQEHSQDRLFRVEAPTPQGLLISTLAQDPEARILIDVGNFFRHLSQHEAARIVLEQIPAVEGVLFFDEEGKEQIVGRPDQDTSSIANDQLFHFIRRSKVVGTQLDRLSPSARALTTVSGDTPQELFVQGIGRLRNMQRGNQGAQTTGIVWAPQDELAMRQRLQRYGLEPTEGLSLQDLLRHLGLVQSEMKAKENVFALMVYLEALMFEQLQKKGFSSFAFEQLNEFFVTDTQKAEEMAFEDTQQRPMREVVELLIQRYRQKIEKAAPGIRQDYNGYYASELRKMFEEEVVPAFHKFVNFDRLPARVTIADVSEEQCLVQADATAEATVSEQIELVQQIAVASALSTEHEATRLQHLHQDLLQFDPAIPVPSGDYWELPPAADSGILGIGILQAPNTYVLSASPKANDALLKPIHHLLLVYDTNSDRFSYAPLGFEDAAAYARQLNQPEIQVEGKEFFLMANLPSGWQLISAFGDPQRVSLTRLDLSLIELLVRIQRGLPALPDQVKKLKEVLKAHPDQEERFQQFYKKYREELIL